MSNGSIIGSYLSFITNYSFFGFYNIKSFYTNFLYKSFVKFYTLTIISSKSRDLIDNNNNKYIFIFINF